MRRNLSFGVVLSWLLLLVMAGSFVAVGAEEGNGSDSGAAEVPKVYFGFSTTYLDRPETESGALRIDRVTEGSAAESAGLRLGDQIVAFDGQAFRFENDAAAFRGMARFAPGRALRVTVIRGGAEMDFTMTPEAASPEQIARNVEWLRRAEAQGGRACLPQHEDKAACHFEVRSRVEAAGGRAVIRIERLSGQPARFAYSSREIEIPEEFDWRRQWPEFALLVDDLRPGESLSISFEIIDGNSHIGPILEGTRWEPQ